LKVWNSIACESIYLKTLLSFTWTKIDANYPWYCHFQGLSPIFLSETIFSEWNLGRWMLRMLTVALDTFQLLSLLLPPYVICYKCTMSLQYIILLMWLITNTGRKKRRRWKKWRKMIVKGDGIKGKEGTSCSRDLSWSGFFLVWHEA
jgi:hypothetical protein